VSSPIVEFIDHSVRGASDEDAPFSRFSKARHSRGSALKRKC
jgi:hypothetical protein